MHLEVFDDSNTADGKVLAEICLSVASRLPEIFKTMKKKPRKPVGKQTKIYIVLTDDKTIRKLNKKYRGKNTPTDVLTFNNDFYRFDKSDMFSEIYISIETAMRQAAEHGITIADELILLTVHGLIHSAGFDHEHSRKQHEIFCAHEKNIMRLLGYTNLVGLASQE